MKRAKDIMTRDLKTVTIGTTIIELARLLTENNISGAPVVDEHGKLIGVVTESDLIFQNKKVHIPTVFTILDSFIYLESPEKLDQEIRKIAGTTVGDIYSSDITTVEENTPVDEMATIMANKHIHTLPVVSNGELVGIIGKKDIIRTIIA